jgi:hypothetical protein
MLTGCREFHPRLIEMARGTSSPGEFRAVMAHVKACADCARILDEQVALSAALDGLADESLPEMAEIEARVLAEFDSAAAHEGALRRGRSRVPGIALLAALAVAALVRVVAVERHSPALWHAARVAVKAVEAPVTVAASAAAHPAASMDRARHMVARARSIVTRVRQAAEESEPFVQIPYTVPLSPEENGDGCADGDSGGGVDCGGIQPGEPGPRRRGECGCAGEPGRTGASHPPKYERGGQAMKNGMTITAMILTAAGLCAQETGGF